jgi:cell division protein FtsB
MKQREQQRFRAAGPRELRRRRIRLGLTFVSLALLLNALAGDRGLVEMVRARRHYRTLESSIATLRVENGRLRENVRQLKEDPAAIEALARRELGLMRRGEILVVVRESTSK